MEATMTQEDKQLLLQDLCARLPYGVIVQHKSREKKYNVVLSYGNISYVSQLGEGWWSECKPYLRPMSSMTEDELQRYHELCDVDEAVGVGSSIEIIATHDTAESLDYLNSIHVDYRGLIPKGLAISTEIFNPYED